MLETLSAVIGQIMPGAIDRYRFTATKGQRLVAIANARELIPYISDAVPGWFQAAINLIAKQCQPASPLLDFAPECLSLLLSRLKQGAEQGGLARPAVAKKQHLRLSRIRWRR